MNEIQIFNNFIPTVNGCDLCIASEPFYHANRTIDFHVMIYVTKGVIYVTEDDIDYEVHAGELLFLKKSIHHFGKKRISKGTQWYFVHFYSNSEINYPVFTPSQLPIKQYVPLHYFIYLPKFLSKLSGSNLERSIQALVNYFHSDDPMREWSMNQYFFQLLTDIFTYQSAIVTIPSLSEKICDYLHTHMYEPFSSSALEQHFFLSYKYMAATFKKEKQVTMQQYHTKLRMNEACKLLKSTLFSVNEIGERLGYMDQLYFSRCFHNYIGMSPTIYRKSLVQLYSGISSI